MVKQGRSRRRTRTRWPPRHRDLPPCPRCGGRLKVGGIISRQEAEALAREGKLILMDVTLETPDAWQ